MCFSLTLTCTSSFRLAREDLDALLTGRQDASILLQAAVQTSAFSAGLIMPRTASPLTVILFSSEFSKPSRHSLRQNHATERCLVQRGMADSARFQHGPAARRRPTQDHNKIQLFRSQSLQLGRLAVALVLEALLLSLDRHAPPWTHCGQAHRHEGGLR